MPKLSHNIQPKNGVVFARGKGAAFWDESGKRYIDLSSQTMNLLFGQSHPRILQSICQALERYTFADQDFDIPEYGKAIKKLWKLLPPHLTVFNVRMNDGSSAVECAVKQVRRQTGRSRVLTVDGIYLGQNAQTIHFRGWGKRPTDMLVGGTEDVVFAPLPLPNYARKFEESPDENGDSLAQMIEHHRNRLCCVLLDPIMISSGVTMGRGMQHLLRRADDVCKAYDIPLILDECQTFGWVPDDTISRHFDIGVDVLVLAKGIGGGLPLAVCAAREQFDNLNFGDADYTNGGTGAAVAGLSATCDLLSDPMEQARFAALCSQTEALLNTLVERLAHRIVVRGIGLIWAIELQFSDSKEENITLATEAARDLLSEGVYIRRHVNCLTLKPPRVISHEDLCKGVEVIGWVLAKHFNQ